MAKEEKKYDAIIIGAGLGGLAAGALLSKRGKKVLILEKHFACGGYATNFKRGDFIFDASLHSIGGLETTDFKRILEKCGVLEKIELIKPKDLYTSIFPDFEFTFKNGDIKKIKEDLAEKFPEEKANIKKWFFFMKEIMRELDFWTKYKIIVFAVPAVIAFLHFLGIIRFFAAALSVPAMIPMLLVSDRISADFFLKLSGIKDEKLKALLTQLWSYLGLPPSRLASQYFLIPAYGYFFDGGCYIKGGSQNLSDSLKKEIENNGGEAITSAEVQEILIRNEKAVGVKIKDGREYLGEKIIANVSPLIVYEKFLPAWRRGKEELSRLKNMELSVSAAQVYLGLDVKIENLNPKFKNSYEVFIEPGYDFDKSFEEAMKKDFSGNYGSLALTFYSNIDKSLAPEGKSVMSIIILDNYDRWKNLAAEQYKEAKKQETDKLICAAEKYLPGLTKHIEVVETATPLTMERYTGSAKGAIYGFAQNTSQCGPSRRFKHKSKIKNLFFAGAWTFPGGGFEGAIRSADELVKKIS